MGLHRAHQNESFCNRVLNERRIIDPKKYKGKEKTEKLRGAQGKYMMEVNSLHHLLKPVKKEWSEEAAQYEQQLRKVKQELKDR